MSRIERAIGRDLPIRVLAAETTNLVEESRRLHESLPTATAALGRVITGTALLGATLKDRDRVTVQISGGGPTGNIIGYADSLGRCKAYIQDPQVHLPLNSSGKLDVAGAVGSEGFLNVIKDLGLRQTYQSHVELISGEIGDDLTYYLSKSEQVPSAVGLGVLVEVDGSVAKAGGFLLQLLPGAGPEVAEIAEKMVSKMPSVTDFLRYGGTARTMAATLFGTVGHQWLEPLELGYFCDCSRERMTRALVSLGSEQLTRLAEEDNGAELVCRFCREKYFFSAGELRSLAQPSKEV